MRKILILLTVLFNLQQAQAERTYHFVIKYMPTGHIDFYSGSHLNLAAEIYLSKRQSIQLSYGFYHPQKMFMESELKSGYMLRPEIRHYFKKEPFNRRYYIAIQGMYKVHTKYESIGYAWIGNRQYSYNYQDFKYVYDLHLKGGFQLIHKSGFTMDIYSGLGFRYRQIITKSDANKEILANHSKPPDKYFMSALLGFQLGWAF